MTTKRNWSSLAAVAVAVSLATGCTAATTEYRLVTPAAASQPSLLASARPDAALIEAARPAVDPAPRVEARRVARRSWGRTGAAAIAVPLGILAYLLAALG